MTKDDRGERRGGSGQQAVMFEQGVCERGVDRDDEEAEA